MRFYESLESMVMFCARRPLAAAEVSNILSSGGDQDGRSKKKWKQVFPSMSGLGRTCGQTSVRHFDFDPSETGFMISRPSQHQQFVCESAPFHLGLLKWAIPLELLTKYGMSWHVIRS